MAIGDSFRNAQTRVGDPLGMTSKLVYLTADNVNIDCTGISFIELTSNNTTAANRTFTLTSSNLKGHELFIVFTSGSSNTAQLANSGTCRLQNGAWEPTQYTSIKLVSDGTYWYEQSRGTSTWQTTSSVTVSGDAQAVATAATGTILLTSDNTTATSRTITLTASSVAGHMLDVVFIHATNKVELLADSTTILTKPWYPNQYDTITLISDATRWIELSRTEGAQSTQVTTVALTADNGTVTMVGRKFISIGSDSATATARTFTLVASNIVGQQVTLMWNDATNRGECVTDSTTKLSGDWRPNLYDTLTVVSDGTRWIEISRTYGNTASKVQSVALTADNQSLPTIGAELIILTSDNATAANRTFVPVASPIVGHRLTLLWNSANEGQLEDTATVTLVSAAWEPTNLYQSIQLISDGTRWIELGRADPT